MDEDPPSAAAGVGDALRAADATLSTAESCTGGLLAAAVTAVPGASDYFDSGVVAYDNDAKRTLLGVSREALDGHGAVSEPVARELAQRVRDRAGTTWGLSVTGIAGPTGGTEEKPVGTVYLGVAHAAPWGSGGSYAAVDHHVFEGDRAAVRRRAVESALELLRRHLRDHGTGEAP